MAKYGFGNTLAAFKRSSTGVVEDTTAGRFDSAYVASAILIPSDAAFIETFPFIDAASATTVWIRWTQYGGGSSGPEMLRVYNSTGVKVFTIETGAGTSQFYFWNGATYTNTSLVSAIFSGAALRVFVLKLICGASGSFEFYVNGTLIHSGAITSASMNNVAKLQFSCMSTGASSYISEFLCADFDLRDSHYMQRLANANGADTDGTGGFADINEVVLNEATAIALPAVGNKKTFTKAATVVPAGYQINAMCVAGRGRVSGGVVTDGKFVVRSAGTDYLSVAKSFNGGYEPRGHYLDNDPATATRFTNAGYDAAEFGAQAV